MNLQLARAKLSALERQKQRLETQIQKRTEKAYRALPGYVGLRTIDDLLLALVPHASGSLGVRSNTVVADRATRTRKRLGDKEKAQVRKALAAGTPVAQVAREFGIASVTVYLWKKKWSLTGKRRARSK